MGNDRIHAGRITALFAFLLAGAACQSSAPAPEPAPFSAEEAAEVQRGADIAGQLCAGCHAIGVAGAGAHAEAPPLRLLSQKYPVRALEEALAEGIVVGHPDMPAFAFEPDEIEALLSYLESIQEPS